MKNMKTITAIVAIAGMVLVITTHNGINGISTYNATPLVLALPSLPTCVRH